VQEALGLQQHIPASDLLLVRDLSGHNLRPSEPPPGVDARIGAVLVLLYPDGDDLRLPLTVRSELLPNHRGEVSLPGGATDPEDQDSMATALRECHEELGVGIARQNVWGTLTPIYIRPSNFRITPVVAFVPTQPTLAVNSAEVSAVISVTLRELMDPGIVVVEQWNLRGIEAIVPFFSIMGHKVWGATALILSELVARMRRVLQERTIDS
jgi:8-oxo-dGTP pyrophosphatase MutT (NUDIX family)